MSARASDLPNTRLTGWRLKVARAAWVVIFVIEVSIFSISVPAWHRQLLQDPYQLQVGLKQIGLSVAFFAYYSTLWDAALALALIVLALVIYWRKSDDWMGLLVSIGQLSIIVGVAPVIQALPRLSPAWHYPALLVHVMGLALMLGLFFLFPDGRFVPSWTSWLAVAYLVYLGAWFVFPSLEPPAVPIELHTPAQAVSTLIVTVLLGIGVFLQFYRYRRVSDPLLRQQTKWVVSGFAAEFVGIVLIVLAIIFIPSLRSPGAIQPVFLLFEIPYILFLLFLIPLSIGLSILRYHLWDIDLVIRKTLVYGTLTAVVALLYFGGVVLLQEFFQVVTGQHQSPIATVLSTLVIAALFNSLRARIQDFIDRRFYRHKYDAERALAQFAAAARSNTDLQTLTTSMLGTVESTLQPAGVSLWLKTSSQSPTEQTGSDYR